MDGILDPSGAQRLIQLESRYSKRVNAFLLAVGAVLLVLTGGLLEGRALFGFHGLLALLACALGLRMFDRRVKLRLGPEGLWYAPWGPLPIAWNEIAELSVVPGPSRVLVTLKTGDPEPIRRRMHPLARLDFALNTLLRREPLAMQLGALDATVDEILSVSRQYLP